MRSDRGFTFLTVMFAVVLIGISIGVAAQQWGTVIRREKEEELLFRGQAIQRAIGFYYQTSRPGLGQYPRTLEDLVKDPGSPAVRRYLRKVYSDPITGGDWVLVKDANDRVKGVHSASDSEPLKTAGFPEALKEFEHKTKYSEWVFKYEPQPLVGSPLPGQPAPPAGGLPPGAQAAPPGQTGPLPISPLPPPTSPSPS